MTDAELIDRVLLAEGGFVNVADDRGGCTKFGVTQATLAAWRKAAVDCTDVEKLSLTEAREILTSEYILKPRLSELASDILRAAMVDFAVHSGPSQAIKALQRCLGIEADGICGPETWQAANIKTGQYLAQKVNAQRLRLMGRILTEDHAQAAFAGGWAHRIAEQIEAAI